MKRKLFVAAVLLISFGACMTQKKSNITPVFPKEMSPTVQAGYLELWKKGQMLYDINCAGCHNQVVKRKIVIPEFTAEQLSAYEIRVRDPQHEMAVSESKVNTEELNFITIFLTYRHHDSVALKKQMEKQRDHTHDTPL